MSTITYLIIMCIIGYFLKDVIKVVIIGLVIYFVIQYGWEIVPVSINNFVNVIDSVRGTL